MKAVQGEYIYFLDSDDYIESSLIEVCVYTMEKRSCDIVAFNYVNESAAGEIIYKSTFKEQNYLLETPKAKIDFLAHTQIEFRNLGWNIWSRFFRASLLLENHICFPDNQIIFAEDLAYAMRVCLFAERITVIRDCFYHYIVRGDSIMGMLQKNPLDKFVKLCLDFENFAKEHGFEHEIADYKDIIFSRIIYSEMKKSCKGYREIAEAMDEMGEFEKGVVRRWFGNIKCRQALGLRDKLRTLDMYCEGYLADFVLHQKKVATVPVYWVWMVLNCLKKADAFCTGVIYKMKVLALLINKRCKIHETAGQAGRLARRAFLLGTEDFGNLGDHQIAVAEKSFLQQYFPNVVEVPASKYFTYESQKMLVKEISDRDIIFLTGGGNFGNVYKTARRIRIDIAKKWRKNLKVIMPQTAYYTSDQAGKKALRKDIRLLTRQNHTVIAARERVSYRFLKKYFRCDIILVPDIVLYSKYGSAAGKRENKVILCLRSDQEAVLDAGTKEALKVLAQAEFSKFECMDTQKPYFVSVAQREQELQKVMAKLQSAQLVITDRLHGMIFCAITGTPCLVFENYNHKIRSSYKWLKDLPYVRLVKNMEEVERAIQSGFWKKQYEYDACVLASKYDELRKIVEANSKI